MSTSPRVFKFGGTSVGGRLAEVLRIVDRERAVSPLHVVVSAFGDTTDWLLEAALLATRGERAEAEVQRILAAAEVSVLGALGEHDAPPFDVGLKVAPLLGELRRLLEGVAILRECSKSARDQILAIGERLSSLLVADALGAIGVAALPIDARTWTVTDDTFGAAKVLEEDTADKLRELGRSWSDREVLVHTGFIGGTRDGRTTTLGRNGSDYTAALLGSALGARSVEIFTDVPGVMTADPWIEREAYPVPRLSYREALELAGLGLRMFHPRTMIPLLTSGVPMHIRSTARPEEPGTWVDADGSTDANKPTCVVSLENMALIDVAGSQKSEGRGIGPRVVSAVSRRNIAVFFETQAVYGNGCALVVGEGDALAVRDAIAEELERELLRGEIDAVRVTRPVTLLTLVAEAMGRTVGVAGRFFGALGAIGVNILASAQGATSRSVSCVVEAADTTVAVRAVHASFNLAREQVNVFVLGRGTVGGHLLAQIRSERNRLAREAEVDVRVVGVADSKSSVFDENGIDLDALLAGRVSFGAPLSPEGTFDKLARLSVPVLVDCTAAEGMESAYLEALARGVHVVAANKKPLVLPLAERTKIFDAARKSHRAYRYETTCGASLPVIETLKNLVRTGDRVKLVEGSLSGTLGFLCNEIMRGVPLSEAVADAARRGFTEPHPREDLAGLDAGRKALILARELGAPSELSHVEVTPFIPEALLASDSLDGFYDALRGHDKEMAAEIARMSARGLVLRYLARIEPVAEGRATIQVGPVGVPLDHPATRLRGSEGFVAFTTERYAEYPLVVQGAGAGGAVTAAGVLADILSLSQSLRGR